MQSRHRDALHCHCLGNHRIPQNQTKVDPGQARQALFGCDKTKVVSKLSQWGFPVSAAGVGKRNPQPRRPAPGRGRSLPLGGDGLLVRRADPTRLLVRRADPTTRRPAAGRGRWWPLAGDGLSRKRPVTIHPWRLDRGMTGPARNHAASFPRVAGGGRPCRGSPRAFGIGPGAGAFGSPWPRPVARAHGSP